MPIQKVSFIEKASEISPTLKEVGKTQMYNQKKSAFSTNPKSSLFYNKWYIPADYQFTRKAPDEKSQITAQLKKSKERKKIFL